MNKKSLAIILRALIVLGIIILSAIIIFYFFKLLYPFIIAAFLVFLINPIIIFLQKRARFPRILAVLTTLLIFISAFAGIMTLLIAEIISGTAYLSRILPEKIDSIITSVQTFFTGKVVPFYENITSKFNTLDPVEPLMTEVTRFLGKKHT